jgi:N-acetylglutamate synthase-like GNAT family acetyltransferase
MTDWNIRRAKLEDAIPLADTMDRAYSIYKDRISDLPDVSSGISGDINDNLVWVALMDNTVVGGMVLISQNQHVVLANIAVDPMVSGTGLGRRFLELAGQEARKLGMKEMRLSTHTDMPENVSLYRHLGWVETGRSGNKVHMSKAC